MNTLPTICPRFLKCSVNNCPLDEQYPNLETHPDDPEPKCTIEKGVRTRISNQSPGTLQMGGLTTREYGALKAFESLSPSVKTERANAARERLKILNAGKSTK